MSNTMIPTFKASTAGRNCILAIHPNHACIVPVKSRNNSVMIAKNTTASVSLILRNIAFNRISYNVGLLYEKSVPCCETRLSGRNNLFVFAVLYEPFYRLGVVVGEEQTVTEVETEDGLHVFIAQRKVEHINILNHAFFFH